MVQKTGNTTKVKSFFKRAWRYLNKVVVAIKKRFEVADMYNITVIFTYLLTVLFTILIVFNQFEDSIAAVGLKTDVFEFIYGSSYDSYIKELTSQNQVELIDEIKLSFGYCSGITPGLFFNAKIMETLIPTTLTLGVTTLITNNKKRNRRSYAFLVLCLFSFTMIGMFFMVTRLESMMKIYMIALSILLLFSLVLSKHIQTQDNSFTIPHKKEPSDGKFTR